MNKTTTIALAAVIVALGAFYFLLGTGAKSGDKTPTSADNAPPGSIHNLPVPEAVSRVKEKVTNETGVPLGEVIVLSVQEMEWPNSCLGIEVEGQVCAQVITPGYRVSIKAGTAIYDYRTNADGSVIRLEGLASE